VKGKQSACPVCEPAAFDGALDVVPVAVPCLAHAGWWCNSVFLMRMKYLVLSLRFHLRAWQCRRLPLLLQRLVLNGSLKRG
jgi:hypothetical protein